MLSGWFHRFFGPRAAATPIRNTRRPLLIERLEDRDVPSTLQGNQLFPSDNPWNQKVNTAPVAANSAALVSNIGLTDRLHPDFGNGSYAGALLGIPYNVVSGTQAKLKVIVDDYASESDIVPVPIPSNAVIEGDPLTTGDRHLLVYDKDNNIAYELYHARRPSETGDGYWHADSLAVWDMKKDSFRPPTWTSADAAGLPILPGLIRADEVFQQGSIDHAIRFTVGASANSYVYPASHQAGRTGTDLPRMGERFRLKQSFDISGFSKANQVILQALKDYGMIVADNGGDWFIGGDNSPLWNNDDLHQLTSILGSSFEVVDLKPVVQKLSVTAGPGGTSVTISGLNFSGGAGKSQVYFGSTAASSFTINSDSSITVAAPAGTSGTTVTVSVHSPYGNSSSSSSSSFTYQLTTGGSTTPSTPPAPPTTDTSMGEIDFSQSQYVVNENTGTATLTLRRLFSTQGSVTVGYVVTPTNSLAASTVLTQTGTVTFAAGEYTKAIVLAVKDDTLANSNRNSTIALTTVSGNAVIGTQKSTTLKVLDNERKIAGTLQFGATRYYVSEGATMAQIVVNRVAGSYGTVSVAYSMQNNTAYSVSDYTKISGTLVFRPGEVTKTLSIPILDDSTLEKEESARILLGKTTGGAILGSVNKILVVIEDNDNPAAPAITRSTTLDPALLLSYEVAWPWKKFLV